MVVAVKKRYGKHESMVVIKSWVVDFDLNRMKGI